MSEVYNNAVKNTKRGCVQPGVVLRDVIESDLPVFFEHQRDPDAIRMAAFPSRDRDGREHFVLQHSGKPEVGYWIGKQHWGKRVATSALLQFLGHLKPRPLYAHAAKHNLGSIRVLEKCGFVICGEDAGQYVLKLSASDAR